MRLVILRKFIECMKVSMKTEMTFDEIIFQLTKYDIITFDVFDTLVTRCVYKPDDIFSIVEAEAKHKGLTNHNFASDRFQAERAAYKQYGEAASFQQIYDMLKKLFSYEDTQCNILKELEFQTELRFIVPRTAVRDLVYELLNLGKRIVLCSDMYLSGEGIRQLLVKCGYPEDLEIWVSSEKGGTKHSGKLWERLFNYLPPGEKSIHIGDNEYADYQKLRQFGRDALLIDSGLTLFQKSDLYGYLSKFATDDIGNSLVLGYLINKACFNSPFADTDSTESTTSIWGGAVFACFMDFLVKNKDDSQLLFATREGYLLKSMYERYCEKKGVVPQDCTLFYSSRAATSSAMITSEKDIWDVMRRPNYQGTVGHFAKYRLNFDLSCDWELYNRSISLPSQRGEVFEILKPYFPQIIPNGRSQKEAYRQYISEIRQNGKQLTIVDIGYNGTIQYCISKILGEKVSGMYLFLNDGALPKKNGCKCISVANTRDGQHPIYDNLLFLEAVMQVPYGQLQKMEIKDGSVKKIFNADANFSPDISGAQRLFTEFVEMVAEWERDFGDALVLNFELAEAMWICLLRFGYLPKSLLESFWLADDYCGHPVWKYDYEKQQWMSKNKAATPLSFALVKNGMKLSLKCRIKNKVKKAVPYFAYDWASRIWQKYFQ